MTTPITLRKQSRKYILSPTLNTIVNEIISVEFLASNFWHTFYQLFQSRWFKMFNNMDEYKFISVIKYNFKTQIFSKQILE